MRRPRAVKPEGQPSVRVVLADEEPLVPNALRTLLEEYDDIDVVGQAANGGEVVGLARELNPDVVLMEIGPPIRDGIGATREIAADTTICTRVLILSTLADDEQIYWALQAGASGFMLRDKPASDIASAIRTVARGEALLGPVVTRRIIEQYLTVSRSAPRAVPPSLTRRELAVLRELGRGRSNPEIAARLFISEATVKTHVSRVLGKLSIRDRAQAVVAAYELGVIRPGEDT